MKYKTVIFVINCHRYDSFFVAEKTAEGFLMYFVMGKSLARCGLPLLAGIELSGTGFLKSDIASDSGSSMYFIVAGDKNRFCIFQAFNQFHSFFQSERETGCA